MDSSRVLPLAESLSNKEMRAFGRNRAHQPTSETINASLWRRTTKPAASLCQYLAVVVLATKKTCGLTFLCC